MSNEDAIAYTTASISQSLGTMHNTLLPEEDVQTVHHLVAAQFDWLVQRKEREALKT